jgi:site-specific recombinase XerD
LDAYLEAAGLERAEKKSPLFRSFNHKQQQLTGRRLRRTKVVEMVKRRARQAGLADNINCHTFRATDITTYLLNGGTLEHAQQIAAHESPRTTKLYYAQSVEMCSGRRKLVITGRRAWADST